MGESPPNMLLAAEVQACLRDQTTLTTAVPASDDCWDWSAYEDASEADADAEAAQGLHLHLSLIKELGHFVVSSCAFCQFGLRRVDLHRLGLDAVHEPGNQHLDGACRGHP